MSPFEIYLRTGRIVLAPEEKFNPWHDPEDGRFTFRNSGKRWGPGNGIREHDSANRMARKPPKSEAYGGLGGGGGGFDGGGANGGREVFPDDRFGGFGGGGGGFNGGGASGSWDTSEPKPKQTPRPASIPPQTTVRQARSAPRERPFTRIEANGYSFQLDDKRRMREAEGDVQGGPPAPRSRSLQTRAGGSDRRPEDEGGHYIAARFNGPREAFNHFAQDQNFNRSAYRQMENTWAREIAAGRKVHVRIIPRYRGNSLRPSSIRVISTINGRRKIRDFPNEPNGGPNGR